MSETEALRAAAEAIDDAEEIVLACHIGPDGDALGSMIGLATAAVSAGKTAKASFGSPFVVPTSLRFLPAALLVPPQEFPEEPRLMIVLDTGSPDRLGELEANAAKAETLIVIDHHTTNTGFGDIALIEESAAATGEIVFRLLEALGWPVTSEVAGCLLTALMTDTGRFSYSNTTPATLRIAADLVVRGARPEEISRYVYEEAPFGYLKASAAALQRARLDEEARMVSTILTQADLIAAGIDWAETDLLIDTLRLAVEADVAVLAKVYKDGRVKVSMRSRGATDVGSLAASFGGGGHRLAAGFTDHGDGEAIIARVRERLESYR